MTYLPRAIYLNDNDMVQYITETIPVTGWTWKPVGITWHNTGIPTLKQWDAYPAPVKAAWGDNLEHYYKFNEHWHAGPHFCGTPDGGIALGEMRADGVHASCYNSDHYGIETIGDFRHGSDDPTSPRGLASMRSSANIIAALCQRLRWDPTKVINFHRSCARDGHPCPGDLVSDAWAIGLVVVRLAQLQGRITPAPTQPSPPTPVMPVAGPIDLGTTAGVQRALQALGYPVQVDGQLGPNTRGAISAFQKMTGCTVDGVFGPQTRAKLQDALLNGHKPPVAAQMPPTGG